MNGNISNIVIITLLVVILFFAIKNAIPHFKGEGACCGGGSSVIRDSKRKLDNVVAKKVMEIEGMKCENCYTRVHNVLNSIDNVSATVDGKRGTAEVELGQDMDNDTLINAVSGLGYKVVSITDKE